jgi:enterochelin esterase-like enzyme
MKIVLLGPQRFTPTVSGVRAEHAIKGKVALVTAGWQERETDDGELSRALGNDTVNLELYRRAENIFQKDPEFSDAYKTRQRRLREMQELYRFRLEHALEVARDISHWDADPDLLQEQRQDAMELVRRLDGQHVARCREIHAEFEARWHLADRNIVAKHRSEVAAQLADCAALAIAGGHVAVLLNRLTLFGLATAQIPLVLAWSAGAMALTERVVLFHDDPPQGRGEAEVLDAGLGLFPGVVVFPHWHRRLHVDDRERMWMLAQRFAPASCLTLDNGARVTFDGLVRHDGPGITRLQPEETPQGDASGPLRVALERQGNLVITRRGKPVGKLAPTPPKTPERSLAIRQLVDASVPPSNQAIESFIKSHAFPIVEGTSITFVFRGEANSVSMKYSIFGLPSSQSLHQLHGTDLWYFVLELPEKSRFEYKFEVVRGDSRELIQDLLNRDHARDPFGINSVAHTAGYEVPEWTQPDPESRPGTLDDRTIRSAAFGGERRFTLYLPARFRRTRTYPLLVVHDGGDYLNYAGMKVILDNLIHRLEVPEFVAVFSHPEKRLIEYANSPAHARFITEELIPSLEAELPLMARAEGRCLMGASFGAVASFSTAWRAPGFYGRLLLQSGSFAFSDVGKSHDRGAVFDPVVEFVNAYRGRPVPIAERVFMSCGVYESLIYENRSMFPLLRETGMDVRYVEARDGHNWENWRDRLREGFSWLFPGPLMMVYE